MIRQSDVPPDVWQKLQAAAGMPVRAKRKAPDVRTKSRGGWSITLTLACAVTSEANSRSHWTVKLRRKEIQCEALAKALRGAVLSEHTPPLPVRVTWTRIGRQLQDDDNLANSFKGLRDALAKWLQVDDGDTGSVSWAYRQESGEPGVVVRIENRTQEG